MVQRIQAPDGSILEFPDGMVDGEIAAVMRREYGGPAAAPKPPPATAATAPALPRKGRTDADVRASPAYQEQRASAANAQNAGNRIAPNLPSLLDRLPIGMRAGLEATMPGPLRALMTVQGPKDKASGIDASRFAAPLPLVDELAGVAQAGGMAARNLLSGKPIGDVRAAYLAGKDQESEAEDTYQAAHRGRALAATAVGAAMPINVGSKLAAAAKLPRLAKAGEGASKAARAVKGLAGGSAAGGAYAAAYGAADGEGGLEGRTKSALAAVPAGMAGGALLTGGAMALPRLAAAGQATVRRLSQNIRDIATPGAERAATGDEIAAAEGLVDRVLARAGLRAPEDVGARLSESFAGDTRATTAELAGRNGVGLVTSYARQPGKTADEFERVIGARVESNPQHTLDMAALHLGVDPEMARGNVDRAVETSRAAAEPLYEQAYAMGPLDPTKRVLPGVPSLDELSRTPDMARAVRDAAELAAMERKNPYALGLLDMDAAPTSLPTAGVKDEFAGEIRRTRLQGRTRTARTGPSPLDETDTALLRALRKGEDSKLREGPTLTQFLAKEGGMHDLNGDLAAMDAQKWHVGKPFQPKVVKPGGMSSEDEAALRAWEAGYFPRYVDEPPPREVFMEALRDDLSGRRKIVSDLRYDPARRDQVAALDALEERLARLGLNARTATDDEIGKALSDQSVWNQVDVMPDSMELLPSGIPDRGPITSRETGGIAPDVQPHKAELLTAESWDMIKRAHDDLIATKYSDRATGELLDTDAARAAVRNNQLLRQVLDELNPVYADARAVAGDGLSMRGAFRAAKGDLTYGSVDDFRRWWNDATLSQKDGRRAGLVNEVLQLVERGALRNGKFSVPGVRQKLEIAFPGRADGFIRAMEAQSSLNKTGVRMAPGTNTTTPEAQAFAKQPIAPEGYLEAVGSRLLQGRPFAAAGVAIGKPVASALELAGLRSNEQIRDEIGRLLAMPPSELEAFIRRMRQASEIRALPRKRVLQAGAAGGVVSQQGR